MDKGKRSVNVRWGLERSVVDSCPRVSAGVRNLLWMSGEASSGQSHEWRGDGVISALATRAAKRRELTLRPCGAAALPLLCNCMRVLSLCKCEHGPKLIQLIRPGRPRVEQGSKLSGQSRGCFKERQQLLPMRRVVSHTGVRM